MNIAEHTKEYCELETFRPQCLKNEVIMIESAIYGRRYVSRCLQKENFDFDLNPSFLGCSADVIAYVSTKCSGQKQCEIFIPDANLQQAQPCPVGLDMFLEVRYSCIEGRLCCQLINTHNVCLDNIKKLMQILFYSPTDGMCLDKDSSRSAHFAVVTYYTEFLKLL